MMWPYFEIAFASSGCVDKYFAAVSQIITIAKNYKKTNNRMGLVTHMLAHVVPRHARPFGATLLTVWLILPGIPRTPARSAFSFSPTRKLNFSQAQKQQPKADTPRPPPRFSRKRKHTRQPDTQPDEDPRTWYFRHTALSRSTR